MVAAAIVFIPELLSGPKQTAITPEAAHSSTESATRTYTIDLEHQPAASPLAPSASGEVTANAPPPEIPPEQAEPTAQSPPVGSSTVSEPPAVAATESPRPAAITPSTARDPEKARSKPEPVKQAARVGSGWAVQVGSFGTSSSAQHIAQQFVQKGYNAYTQPVQVGAKTLYRVRLGPTAERSEAETLLKKIKADQPNATLVSEP